MPWALLGRSALGLALLATVLSMATWLDGGPPWAPLAPRERGVMPSCASGPTVVWRNENGTPLTASPTLLTSNTSVHACVDSAGVLGVTLRGTIAESIGSRAVLIHGHERLLDVELRDEAARFEVHVPSGGLLVLAFVNDRYVPPEDRNLWVSRLDFTPSPR